MTYENFFITVLTEYANNTGQALRDLDDDTLRQILRLATQLITAINEVLEEGENA